MNVERNEKTRHHVVGRHDAHQFDSQQVAFQCGTRGIEYCVADFHIDSDRADQRNDRAFTGIEGTAIAGSTAQGVELRLRAARLEEFWRMVMELVDRAISPCDLAHRQLAQPGPQFEVVPHIAEESVPSSRERRAVQQHAIKVEQRAAATGANRIDDRLRLREVRRLIGNARHVFLLVMLEPE